MLGTKQKFEEGLIDIAEAQKYTIPLVRSRPPRKIKKPDFLQRHFSEET
jgi:hypothetical protein